VSIRRRDFITLLGGAAAAWPLAARAQQLDRVRQVGVLMNSGEIDPDYQAYVAAFRQGLRKLGWIEGQNLHIDVRWNAGDAERARALAGELLRLSPDVILAASTTNLAELLRRGPTMPIVFVLVSDPVAQGFVSNLAHPGGNITGFSTFEFSIGGKWIGLLKQIAPGLTHVAVISNPRHIPPIQVLRQLDRERRAVARGGGDRGARSRRRRHRAGDRDRVAPAERRPRVSDRRLPGCSPPAHRRIGRPPPRARDLFKSILHRDRRAHDTNDFDNQFRQAAVYIDRILRGAKPGDLPVQGPTKYSFVINLKAANALGIEVPTNLLLTADDYIE
jgi:putative ABC transport system substrate-binding protein